MNFSKTTTTVVVFALVALALASISASAATTEMANETVTFDNSSNLTVSVDWNESITDPANATADVAIYNATEYDDDPANATLVLEDTIASDPDNTTDTEYTEADGLVDGDDYRVLVTADDLEADSVTIDDGSLGGIFPGSDSGTSSGVLGIVIIAAAIGFVAWRTSNGGDRS